jgi:hypothetical protein
MDSVSTCCQAFILPPDDSLSAPLSFMDQEMHDIQIGRILLDVAPSAACSALTGTK